MRILLIDDHPVVRQGVQMMLAAESTWTVVAEAATATAAIDLIRNPGFECDLVILDLNLPDLNGFAVLDEIRRLRPQLAVLILSIQPAEHMAVRALKAGASGYLNKEAAPGELLNAVRAIASGKKYIGQNLAEWLAFDVSGHRESQPHERLSDREYQVLCLLAGGKSITEIAEMLSRSPNTISTYRSRIMQKMGIDTNAGLTQYALLHQLIR